MFSSGANFSQTSLLRLSRDVFVRKNPDGSVILMSTTNEEDKFFRITGVAAEIFEKIDGQTSVESIISSVRNNYDVSEEQLIADAELFLQKLINHSIVTVA